MLNNFWRKLIKCFGFKKKKGWVVSTMIRYFRSPSEFSPLFLWSSWYRFKQNIIYAKSNLKHIYMYIKNASVKEVKCTVIIWIPSLHTGKYLFYYRPFRPRCQRGRIKDLANSYVSNYLSLFTILSGRIQEETKPFVSKKGRK